MTLNILLGIIASWQIMIVLALCFCFFILPKIISQRGVNAYSSESNSALTDQKQGFSFFGKDEREKLRVFESKMKEGGFSKRFVGFDFFSDYDKRMNKTDNLHQWAVGIWINRDKKMVALRLDGSSSNEIVIPFKEFQDVEILDDDGFVKSTVNFLGTAANSRGYSTGLQVRIVTGEISRGITTYILVLFDPAVGQSPTGVPSKLDKSGTMYRSLLGCAKAIKDEIEFIMKNSPL